MSGPGHPTPASGWLCVDGGMSKSSAYPLGSGKCAQRAGLWGRIGREEAVCRGGDGHHNASISLGGWGY
jgi:hypothetical protein